jgi:hypothetical protein
MPAEGVIMQHMRGLINSHKIQSLQEITSNISTKVGKYYIPSQLRCIAVPKRA